MVVRGPLSGVTLQSKDVDSISVNSANALMNAYLCPAGMLRANGGGGRHPISIIANAEPSFKGASKTVKVMGNRYWSYDFPFVEGVETRDGMPKATCPKGLADDTCTSS